MMLLEEISESFGGNFLKRAAGLLADCSDRLPSIVIELDALAGHGLTLEVAWPRATPFLR